MVPNTNSENTRQLDAREISGEPFDEIMNALNDLEADDTLLLINTFEPEPLYNVLEQRGFSYEASQVANDEWHVQIETV